MSWQPPQPLVAAGDLEVRLEADLARLEQVAQTLDAREAATGTPLVDEAERERLGQAVAGQLTPGEGWWPALAWHQSEPVGYVAVMIDGPRWRGDAAALHTGGVDGATVDVEVLGALLRAAGSLAAAGSLQVWTRHAGQPEIEVAKRAGFRVARKLGVLGRTLDASLPAAPAPAAHIRAFDPGEDDTGVVEVLAAAYAGTDEAGWDLAGFRERTRLPWFRAEDLLVAERDHATGEPRLGGLHWLKRRDATTGEVYNLAIHPAVQGEGLGPALLHAGLAHLRNEGLAEVILWVDLANERAVDLYHGQGFETRWLDLALDRVEDADRVHDGTGD